MVEIWTPKSTRLVPPYQRLEQELTQMLQSASSEDRWGSYSDVKAKLRKAMGEWAGGWCWGEIDGGPVRRWCCFDHSFLQGKPGEEPALTVTLVLNGLRDWEKSLDECEALFAGLPVNEPIDLDIAVLEIVRFAVDLTAASDAWYSFCILLLSWYLQSLGVFPDRAATYAGKAVAGQFESWSAPSDKVLDRVGETFRELAWRDIERRRS